MVIAALIMLTAMDRPGNQVYRHGLSSSSLRGKRRNVIRGIALSEGIVIHAEALGKYKFILQAFAVVGLLVHYTYWGVISSSRESISGFVSGHRRVVRNQLPYQFFRLRQARATHGHA